MVAGHQFESERRWEMRTGGLAETVDFYRVDASLKLDANQRSQLGQYMTPVPIGLFMASLFTKTRGKMRVLDPGAGVGSLTAAVAERICSSHTKPSSVDFICYEVDSLLCGYLRRTLKEARNRCAEAQIGVIGRVLNNDFILSHNRIHHPGLFDDAQDDWDEGEEFTHVIMNPPYRKIHSDSAHRAALRRAGVETSNLYTGFMFLAALRLGAGGEMTAIIPRSFCNGPYFQSFRERFFSMMSLRHVHVFETRDDAFKDDAVLQENIIIHAVKERRPADVMITTSRGAAFELDPVYRSWAAQDMTQRMVPHSSVIRPGDSGRFVHITTNGIEQSIVDRMSCFRTMLPELGIEVSTGPVVDFRLKDDLRAEPEVDTVPLLYAAHFQGGSVSWPKAMRKPNAIRLSKKSRKWLWANHGNFVVTKRFTSKEERRRIVASVYAGDLPGDLVGFENHLNVYHDNRAGMPRTLAVGLSLYLNCSLVDRFFRQFNGHTQVNAADLRSLCYPDREVLEQIGRENEGRALSQHEIDAVIEKEVRGMADDNNPLDAQRKIDEALEILKAFGMPRGQVNDRSALTLLALLDLKPGSSWDAVARPLIGITPIMEFVLEQYGRKYAPNTRETFRRQTMHQFVEGGIAVYNPDDPLRPVNSPNACYQISREAYQAIRTFGSDAWQKELAIWLKGRETLSKKWAKRREMQRIPVQIAEDALIMLTPGDHSELIRDIIKEFGPRFAPGAEVLYVGDTGDKMARFEQDRLAELGMTFDRHGKMPDIVLYFGEKNWLLLVESVTSHGPVDPKRHNELAELFIGAKPGLVYVTAFPNRTIMGRHLGSISWETEVWCADAPDHLIHFDGKRFLGPYQDKGV